MVEAILNLLQINREVIFRHAQAIVQNMLSKRPEAFDPIDMIRGPAINEALTVTDRVMFAIALPQLIATKGIRVIDGAFAGRGLNMSHEGIR